MWVISSLHCVFLHRNEFVLEIARLLLEKGAGINLYDDCGRTPLHYAVTSINEYVVEIVRLLLDKGADINLNDEDRRTPLHYAFDSSTEYGIEIVRLLMEKRADINLMFNKAKNDEMTEDELQLVWMLDTMMYME